MWPRSEFLDIMRSAWERTKIIPMKYAPVSAVAKKSPFGLGKGQQRVVRRVQGEEGTEMVAGEGPVRGRAVPHGRERAGQSLGRRRRAGGQRFLAGSTRVILHSTIIY